MDTAIQRVTGRGRWAPTRVLTAVVGVLALLGAVSCSSGGGGDYQLSGWVRDPLPSVDTVAVPDATANDTPFEFRAPPGGILLVYFGFTFCPDMCPTTLSDVQAALTTLGDDADRVSVAFVTVDPDRDRGEQLTSYIGFFTDGRGHALRTDDPGVLRQAADAFGVDYEVKVSEEGKVDVGHTANLFAVDDQGRLLVTWPFGTDAETLAADIAYLLDQQQAAQRS